MYYTEGDLAREKEIEVKEFVLNGMWNEEKLRMYVSTDMVTHIMENINTPSEGDRIDIPLFTGNSKGLFTVKSAYHMVRSKMNVIE